MAERGEEIELANLAKDKEADAAADDEYKNNDNDDIVDRMDLLRQPVQRPAPLNYEAEAKNMIVDNFYKHVEDNLGKVRTKPINYENFIRKKTGLWYKTEDGKLVRLTWAKDPSRFLGLSTIMSEANRAGVSGSLFVKDELGIENRFSV